MQFQSLEQRMAQTFLDRLPPFVPAVDGPPASEQERLYGLIKSLYQLGFDEPGLLVPQLHGDDAYPNRFNKASYGKTELLTHMRRFQKEISALLQGMFALGAGEAVKLSKRQKEILGRLGALEGPPFEAWAWMATRPGADVHAFAHCLFSPGYRYAADVYARLLGDEAAFRKLEGWMLARGYAYFENLDAPAHEPGLAARYANLSRNPAPPSGGFEYGVKHTGVSLRYDPFVRAPAVLGLCIPGGMKASLSAFERMDAPLQSFVAARTKACDRCGYCVQTDKTGTRPLACMRVAFEGRELCLCTYFPGYRYCFTRLDGALADKLIALLDFLDGL